MLKTRHRIFAIAAWVACLASARAEEISAYVPAIALPPETMGNIPPIPTVSNSTASTVIPASSNVQPAGFFPTQMSKPNSAPTASPVNNTTIISAPTVGSMPPMSVSGQRWRWYGYGAINGRSAGNAVPFNAPVNALGFPQVGMTPANEAPTMPPANAMPASIGVPQSMSNVPAPPVTTPAPATLDGPAIPQAAPEIPPTTPPALDLRNDSAPKAPIPAPPVEPWNGAPSVKAPATIWQPVVARASSAR